MAGSTPSRVGFLTSSINKSTFASIPSLHLIRLPLHLLDCPIENSPEERQFFSSDSQSCPHSLRVSQHGLGMSHTCRKCLERQLCDSRSSRRCLSMKVYIRRTLRSGAAIRKCFDDRIHFPNGKALQRFGNQYLVQ